MLFMADEEWRDSPPPGLKWGGSKPGRRLNRSAASSTGGPPSVPDAENRPVVGLTATYTASLERMGRAESPEGQLVIHLASMLEFSGGETLASKAAIAGRLMAAWDVATAGAAPEVDALDEITRKRREKFG